MKSNEEFLFNLYRQGEISKDAKDVIRNRLDKVEDDYERTSKENKRLQRNLDVVIKIKDEVQAENDELRKQVDDSVMVFKEISQGKGRYSMDKLQHASNTIEDMKQLALDAIFKITCCEYFSDDGCCAPEKVTTEFCKQCRMTKEASHD